jgi:hypothetical protein|tara:strand:- start:349 stop:534 length:186 start_codon:yes stop_codon:yes gene_type:complete
MGKQIGNDSGDQVTFRKSIYGKSDGGKGARPRPGVYSQQYKDNWEVIFGKKSEKTNGNKKK